MKLTLLSLVKVKLDFLLLDITEIWIRSKESDKNIREELLLEKHTHVEDSSKTILYTYSWKLGFPKYDFYCRETIEYLKR